MCTSGFFDDKTGDVLHAAVPGGDFLIGSGLFLTYGSLMFLNRAFIPVLMFLLAACGQGASIEERVAAARTRYDTPAIFKVTDTDSVLYLYGSVHLLPPGTRWQKRDLEAAFAEAGTVFFETPDGPEADFELTRLQRTYGLYNSGERLSLRLDPAMRNSFSAAAHNAGLSPELLDGFRPWLVADLLTIAAAGQAGLSSAHSVDTVLRGKARDRAKLIRHLEDLDVYFRAVGEQPESVQMQMLKDATANFNTLGAKMQNTNAAWLTGDVETLERDLVTSLKQKSPDIYQALLVVRNEHWAETLDRFLKGDSSAIAVVGVGHLLGPDSLTEKLRARGYDVTRVRRYDLPNE